MANEKKFKLEDNVKALAGYCINLTDNLDKYRQSIDLDSFSRAAEATGMGIPAELESEEMNYLNSKQIRQQHLDALTQEIKPKYAEAKKMYIDGLNDKGKAEHYYELVREGVLPKDASDDLKKLASQANFADNIRNLANRGKSVELAELLRETYKTDVESLLMVNTYAARGSADGIARIANKIADSNEKQVKDALKDKYAEIEKGVTEKEAYGLAFANAYKLYESKVKDPKTKEDKFVYRAEAKKKE